MHYYYFIKNSVILYKYLIDNIKTLLFTPFSLKERKCSFIIRI
ncbi:hypothetical protein M117_3399 [Bacteroides fragilis str. 3774 T13]|nr:hypothetical protein M117_3399 [Bacteroides fragilis str. 3774 T13]EXZ12843.1 hypothetical protein M071_3301 [Bacteroides fragilis str. Ds-233]